MMTRVAPLLGVSAAALVLATVMLARGSDTSADSAKASPAVAAPRVTHLARPTVPAARGAKATVVRHVPHVTLPVDSPWALPPMLVLQARTGGKASAALRRPLHTIRVLIVDDNADAREMLGMLLTMFEASVGMVGFWFLEVTSLLYIVMTLNFFISGHMLPLDLLPQPWAGLLKMLPFQYMAYFPAMVFLGKIRGQDLAIELVKELAWAVAFLLLARALYRLGLRRYSAYGG